MNLLSKVTKFIRSDKSIILLLTIALVNLITIQVIDINLRKTSKLSSYKLLGNTLAYSPDSNDYISYAENYLAGKGFKNDQLGKGAYFYRIPGYSVLYLSARCVFEKNGAFLFLQIFHSLLYLISVYLLFIIVRYLFSPLLSFTLCLPYVTVPFFYSHVYFLLTESVTGFLMVIFGYFIIRGWKQELLRKKIIFYTISSLFIGIITLIRPVLGVFVISLGIISIFDFFNTSSSFYIPLKLQFLIHIPFFACMFTWSFSVYLNTGELVFLNKYSHPTTPSYYKLPTWGLWSVGQSWGEDGVVFNTYALPMYNAAIKGDTSTVYVNKTIDTWVEGFPEITEKIERERLFNAVKLYQVAMAKQEVYINTNMPMPDDYLLFEKEAYAHLTSIRNNLRYSYPFVYHVKAPLTYFKMLVLNSGTSGIYFFQEPFRDIHIINYLRYIFLLFNVALYLGLLFNIVYLRSILPLVMFVLLPIVYIIVLCYFFRSVEQRYMHPIYPFMLMGLGYPISNLITNFRKRI